MNMGAYLIRTALCLIFFYATYRVLLHDKCHFTISRFYLVGSFLLSFVIPLITIDFSLIQLPITADTGNFIPGRMDSLNAGDGMMTADKPFHRFPGGLSLAMLFLFLYFSGILVFMIRYVLDLFKLIRMIRNNEKQEFRHYTLVKLEYPAAPFSFFRYIFVYGRDVDSDDFLQFIITHEQAHIRNWHSIDSVFLGLGQIIQWFNPVVLLYKKAVVAMHEFSADREVIENMESLAGYQQKILKYAYIKNNIMFTSNLSNTMIKKRFIMMTKKNQGRHNTLRVIASTIIAAFLLLAFSNGDKIGIKSIPDGTDLFPSVNAPDNNTFPALSPIPDTSRQSAADQKDSGGIQNIEDEEEVRILKEELNPVKHLDLPDSLSLRPHVEFFMAPENFNRHMAEIQAELAERQLRDAERQLRLAEEQQMLAERLEPLCKNLREFPDKERLRRMAEAQARMEQFRPMIGEYFLFPPIVHPFRWDGDCPDEKEMQSRFEEQLKNLGQKHIKDYESLRSLKEKDLRMMEEQQQWQEKYHQEMEKQRDQMEKTRRQLMDEYLRMMNKYRDERGND